MKESILCAFVTRSFEDGLAAGSVKSYLAAVRHTQIALGLGDPRLAGMPKLEYVVKGVRRKSAGKAARQRLLITPPILRKLKSPASASLDSAGWVK